MSALSMILQPTVASVPKQEVDETVEMRPAKRRKSIPPTEKDKSSTPEKSAPGNKDERKRQWLAGLSHDELLGVAQGAIWQVGGQHAEKCFGCKKEGTLLECHNCPRSYHRRCLDPPIHGNFKVDQPWFCPNCALLQLSMEDPVHRVMSRSASDQEKPPVELPSLRIGDVTPMHRTPLPKVQERPHKRSRYTTLPEHIDEALGLLNRELESAFQAKRLLREMASKIHTLEQELQIRKGQEALLPREPERELSPGREVLESLGREIMGLRRENGLLREDIKWNKAEARTKDGLRSGEGVLKG